MTPHEDVHKNYKDVITGLNITLSVMTSFCFIFCLALTHMWKHVLDDEGNNLSERTALIKRDFCISLVICFMLVVPFLILFLVPYYINKMIVESQLSPNEMSTFKLLYWVACVFFIIGWML